MPESTLEQIQADTKTAMKAGDKPRVGALRLIADALQKDLKSGGEDEVAVLRRERKRRLEAAEAYRSGGDSDRAEAEESEAELISGYLPAETVRRRVGRRSSTRRSPRRAPRARRTPARSWAPRWARWRAAPTASA